MDTVWTRVFEWTSLQICFEMIFLIGVCKKGPLSWSFFFEKIQKKLESRNSFKRLSNQLVMVIYVLFLLVWMV